MSNDDIVDLTEDMHTDQPGPSNNVDNNADFESDKKSENFSDHNVTMSLDEGKACMICYAEYTTSGEHRPACVECGHIFGLSCLQRWLKSKTTRFCPTCKHPCKNPDKQIRPLWCKGLLAVDNSEAEEYKRRYEEERQRAEDFQELLVHQAINLKDLEVENKQLRRKLKSKVVLEADDDDVPIITRKRPRRVLDETVDIDDDEIEPVDHPNLKLFASSRGRQPLLIDSANAGVVRCAAYSINRRTLVVSIRGTGLFSNQYGYKLITKCGGGGFSQTQVVCHHDKIYDIKLAPNDPGYVLTASDDATLKISTQISVLQKFRSPVALWACAFDMRSSYSNYIYGGAKNGKIYVYDRRRTAIDTAANNHDSDVYSTITTDANSVGGPIVQLFHNYDESTDNYGFISSKLNLINYFNQDNDVYNLPAQEYNTHRSYHQFKLPITGLVSSIYHSDYDNRILVTMRPSSNRSKVTHEIHRIVSERVENVRIVRSIMETSFSGGSTQTPFYRNTMFKSQFVTHERNLCCVFDEESMSLLIHDAQTGDCLAKQRLAIPTSSIKLGQIVHVPDENQLAVICAGRAHFFNMQMA